MYFMRKQWWRLLNWASEILLFNHWKLYITTNPILTATKHDRMVTYLERLLLTKSHDPLITWSCKKEKPFISTITLPMANKIGKTVTYIERLPLIQSYNPLITWSCEITWQIKNVILPLKHWTNGHQTWPGRDSP